MIKGIDTSQWNGISSWDDLEQDYKSGKFGFIAIRATYGYNGTLQIDEQFEESVKQARERNILHGFYHYADPKGESATAQASFFASTIDLQTGEFTFVDYEEDVLADPASWVDEFNNQIASHYNGYRELVYIDLAIAQKYDWSKVIKDNDGLILAQWTNDPNAPLPQTKWSEIAFRQYADNGTDPGITGNVDQDEFFGDTTQLQKYLYTSPQQTMYAFKALVLDPINNQWFTFTDVQTDSQTDNPIWNTLKDSITAKTFHIQRVIDGSVVEDINTNFSDDITQATASLTGQISSLQTQLSNQNTKLQSASIQYANATAQLTQLKELNTTLQSQILDAQTQNQKDQTTITTLTGQVGQLTKQLSTLQESAKGYIASQQTQKQIMAVQNNNYNKLQNSYNELVKELNYHKLILDLQGEKQTLLSALGTVFHHFFNGSKSNS